MAAQKWRFYEEGDKARSVITGATTGDVIEHRLNQAAAAADMFTASITYVLERPAAMLFWVLSRPAVQSVAEKLTELPPDYLDMSLRSLGYCIKFAGTLRMGVVGIRDVTAAEEIVAAAEGAASRAARLFTSADTHVAGAANAIEAAMPGSVLDVNKPVRMTNGLSREVDIILKDLLVQVKGEKAVGLIGQIQQTEATTGIRTIGYAPSMPTAAWVSAAREGVPIARNIDELIAMIKELR